MSTSRYTIELNDEDAGAAALVAALKRDSRFRVHVDRADRPETPESFTCRGCESQTRFAERKTIPDVAGLFCPLCHDAGMRILDQGRVAHHRHWRAILARIPEFIRRTRSGDADPVFYGEAGE